MSFSVFCRLSCRALLFAVLLDMRFVVAAAPVLIVDNPGDFRGEAVSFSVDAFAANDHVPLRDFAAEPWPANYRANSGDNVSFASLRAALGASKSGLSLDFIRRGEAIVIATGDVAHAHYLAQTDQLFSGVRSLSIDYQLKGFEADGVRFGAQKASRFTLVGGHTRWGAAFSILRGKRLRAESATGHFFSDGNTASLNGRRELWYSDLVPSADASLSAFHPFNTEAVPTHGTGYALDIGFVHDFESGARLSAAVNDLIGKLKWRQMPHMAQDFSINNLSASEYTSDGTPAVSGHHDYRDYTMSLEEKYLFAVTLPVVRNWDAKAQIARTAGLNFPIAGVVWKCGESCSMSADYDTRWKSFGINASRSGASIALRSDRANLSTNRALGFQFAVHYPF